MQSSLAGASCEVNSVERAIYLKNVASSDMDGTQTFKITGGVTNPVTVMGSFGDFTIQTLVNTDQIVDQAIITDPFSIVAGELYAAQMTFDPSVNSEPNPTVSLAFTNQHELVSGSLVSVTIPTHNNELTLSSQYESLTCSGT
jgi:hypothetical protein